MLTSKYSQKNELSHKPFASVRFVVDPPEGLKKLDLKLKKPTLFIEVIHGDKNGILNKQWIPLHLQHDPKIPVEQKTHYGQKTVTSKKSNIPAAFDTKAIADFIFPRTQKNKNVPFVLTGSESSLGKNLTLCIPTSSGECQLAFTSDGNISINRAPSDLDLKIETDGNIKIGSDLQCRAVHLIAKNIENRHSLLADTIQLEAQKKITNTRNIMGKQSLTVTAEDLENNQTGKILGNNIHIVGNTVLDNSGLVKAQRKLDIKTQANLINQKAGTLKSEEILDINVKSFLNAGRIDSTQNLLMETQNVLENQKSGRITSKKGVELSSKTVIHNSGKIDSLGPVKCEADKIMQDLESSRMESEQLLSLTAKSLIENRGVLSGNSTDLKVTDISNGILKQLDGATISGVKKITLDSKEISNAGLIESALGKLGIKSSAQFNNHKTGVLKILDTVDIKSEKLSNSGEVKAGGNINCEADKIFQDQKESKIISGQKLALLAKTTIENSGVMFGKERFEIPASTCLNNATTGILASDEHLEFSLSAQSKNHGELSAKTLILSAEDLENSTSGKISGENINFIGNTMLDNSGHVAATKKLSLQTDTVLTNQKTGVLEAGELVDLDIRELKNSGEIKSTEKLVLKAKTVVNNLGTMKGASIDMTIASYNQPTYSFFNRGDISAENGDFTFTGQGISHTEGSIKSNQSISIKAVNINLPAETTAEKNIDLHSGGGIWFVKEAVKATGELSFHFPEGYTVTEERTVQGSLKYALSPSATKPFLFLANQTAKNGSLKIETPTPVSVGSDTQFVSLLASGKLETTASHFTLNHGRMVGNSVKLSSNSHILLGHAGKYCGIGSAEEMEFNAPGNMVWDHLDLTCGRNLAAKTASVDDISSRLHVVGDATLPHGRHRLLTEYKANGYNIPWRDWDLAFESYKTIGPSLQPLTGPAKLTIGGKLILTGQTEIFGSQVSCGSFEGVSPSVNDFFPYQASRRAYFCGNKKYRDCFWVFVPPPKFKSFFKCVVGHQWAYEWGTPISAVFSVGGHFQPPSGLLNIQGIVTATSIAIEGIQTGLIGQRFDLMLRLPPPKPFRSRIPLMEYATKPTMLYDIKEFGFPSVYQPVIPFNLVGPLGPIIVVGYGGFLRPNTENRRCLFSPLQERALLVEAMMDGLGRGFLASGLTDSQKMLAFLRENAEQTMQDKKTGLVSQEGTRSLPMMVYQEIEFIHASGKKEIVLVPDFCIPKAMDNPRLRDGAGGLFALGGDILLRGANQANSILQISGHIDAKGKVVFSQFNTLTESKRTVKEMITVVDTNTTKSCFGLIKKTHQTEKKIEITHVEPGNTVSGSEVVYENITNVQWQGLQMAVGEGGVHTQNVHSIEERVVVTNTVQALENKQRNLLGSMSSTTHVVQSQLHPSTIQSLGPINLKSITGTYDTLQAVSNKGVQITAQHLSFHVYLRQLEEARRNYEALMEDAKRHSKRQQRRMLIKMIAGIAVGAVFAPMLAQSLLATVGTTGILTSKTAFEAAYIVTRGAIFGGIRSSITGNNPLKGTIQGGIFAGVGFAVENMLSSVETLKELETLRDAIQTTVIASLDTALNGGNLVENVLASVAADFVANKTVGKPDGTIVKQVTRALVETAMISTMTNSTTLGPNLIASGLGSLAQGVGNHYGRQLVSTVTVKPQKNQKIPQNPPLIFSQVKPSQNAPRDSSLLQRPMQQSTFEIKVTKSWLNLAWRAMQGEKSREITDWQRQNRQQFSQVAKVSDDLQTYKPIKTMEGLGYGVKNSFIQTGKLLELLGEEGARLYLGQQTKTARFVNIVTTFFGEEARKFTHNEQTQIGRFINAANQFVMADVTRLYSGEQTQTKVLLLKGYQKLSAMPAEQLAYGVGNVVGDVLQGRVAAKVLKVGFEVASVSTKGLALGIKTDLLNPRPKPLLLSQGGFISIGGVTLDELKKQDFALKTVLDTAQRGIGPIRIHSVTDGIRLNVELALKQANILNVKGELTEHALSNLRLLKEGVTLNNPAVISELTKDGSQMADWAKFTTKEAVALSNGQKIQVHFYQNKITGEVCKKIDYKTTPAVLPTRVYSKKM